MTIKLIVISGGLACGKSELSKAFKNTYRCDVVRTSDLILDLLPGTKKDRKHMRDAGNLLDRKYRQEWIATEVAKLMRERAPDSPPLVLDGVRKPKQMAAIQRSIGHRYVRHVHLHADYETQRRRFKKRKRSIDVDLEFEEAINDPSEKKLSEVARVADIYVDTGRYTPADVFTHVSSRLNMNSRSSDQLVDVLVGGQYGSEGKGNIADYLSPEYSILMRVGGPNAGHIVYEEPPFTHISLPCGTRRNQRAQILIGPGAVINPEILLKEIRECEVEPNRLIIDENAVLIEAKDIEWEEENLKKEIGSTANGVGVAAARRLQFRFRDDRACKLAKDLKSVQPELAPYVGSALGRLEDAYRNSEKILLEGTQGTGLSIFHGEYPSVTSRDTAVSGCLSEAGIGPRRVRKIVLVCRTYPIRVGGNSGSFSKAIKWETIAQRSGIDAAELKKHEVGSRSKTPRRVGEFDWRMLRKACHLNSPTDIALTFADYLNVGNREAIRFEQLSPDTINFIEAVELVSGVPCSLIANRFDYKCVIDRRRW